MSMIAGQRSLLDSIAKESLFVHSSRVRHFQSMNSSFIFSVPFVTPVLFCIKSTCCLCSKNKHEPFFSHEVDRKRNGNEMK
jgi:hypothetical protein